MKHTNPARALARRVVASLPEPLARALRGAKRAVLDTRGPSSVFTAIYSGNQWDGTESISGPGSSMAATANVRASLPALLQELGVKTLLDVPCGDAYWIGECLAPDMRYIGGDIVADLVEKNRALRGELGEFKVIDLLTDDLPAADLLLVRDCFIHLPNRLVKEMFGRLRKANIRYLLTTTYTNVDSNIDIEIGGYRPVNLTLEPFSWPQPLRLIADDDGAVGTGKSLGLWRLDND